MARKPEETLASLHEQLAKTKSEGQHIDRKREENAARQRELERQIRDTRRMQMGALADECGLGSLPLDLLGEMFLWLAACGGEVTEEVSTPRERWQLLRGGKQEEE